MNKSTDTKKWEAAIKVELTAINQYGDKLGDADLAYTVHLNGTLLEIVAKLEGLTS